jgi:hypothetical protein
MDTLESLPHLSITELRKILSDNGIKDTSQSKEDIILLVEGICLTKLTINDLQTESDNEYQLELDVSKGIEQSRVQNDRETIDKQREEYIEGLRKDLEHSEYVSPEYIHQGYTNELSPRSLREIRLKRFE